MFINSLLQQEEQPIQNISVQSDKIKGILKTARDPQNSSKEKTQNKVNIAPEYKKSKKALVISDDYEIFNDDIQIELIEQAIEPITNKEKKLQKAKDKQMQQFNNEISADILDNKDRRWNKQKDSDLNRITYRFGKFNEEETKLIFQAVIDYAQSKQLTEEELIQICSDKSKREFHRAWNIIGKCIPQRSIQSIHNFVHRKFNPKNHQGSWTPLEEEQLQQLVNENGRRWNDIGKTMNRTALNVRDKYKQMGEENNCVREQGRWDVGEVIGLLRLVEKYQKHKFLRIDWQEILLSRLGDNWQAIDIKEKLFKSRPGKRRSYLTCEQEQETLDCFQAIIDQEKFSSLNQRGIIWTKIAQKIKSKSKDDIRNFWYTTLNLWFLQSSNLMPSKQEEIELIDYICTLNVEHDEDVDFSNCRQCEHLDLNQKMQIWSFIKKRVSIRKRMTDEEIIKVLKEQQSRPKIFELNVTLQTQNTTSTSITQVNYKKTNLFQELFEQYRQNAQNNTINFQIDE